MDEPTPLDGAGSAVSTVAEQNISAATDGDRPLLAFFIPDLSVGGAEQVAITIANGLATREYDIDLLLSRASGELRSELSETGLLIQKKDSNALATALNSLITNPKERERMGTNGKERLVSKGWTWEAHGQRLANLHESIIADGQLPTSEVLD